MANRHHHSRTLHFHLNAAILLHISFRIVGHRVLRLQEIGNFLQRLFEAVFGIGEEGFSAGFAREAIENDGRIVDVVTADERQLFFRDGR